MSAALSWQQEISESDWLKLAQRSLRGRSVSDLSSETRDGIEVAALYSQGPQRPAPLAEAATVAAPRRCEQGWDVRVTHRIGDANRLDAQVARDVADDLAGGATSFEFECVTSVSPDTFAEILGDADTARIAVSYAPHSELANAGVLLEFLSESGGRVAPAGSLGLDPVGQWGRSGIFGDITASVGLAVEALADKGSNVAAFTVDALGYADAGATEAQVLGWATATGVCYLRALTDAGLTVSQASELISFRLPATADVFVTMAALRAARIMWHRIVTASGGGMDVARQSQHAVTAQHTYSRRDPWVNLLRGCTAALAAGVGGADAVTVTPFDAGSNLEDATSEASDSSMGRRLARNTQLLLIQESHLGRSTDPGGGSYYLETLTRELASVGWQILQEVEESGGIVRAIGDGSIAAAIDRSWERRLAGLVTRNEPVIGVSNFPDFDEATTVAPTGASAPQAATPNSGLPVRRLSQPFEDLRDAADRHRATASVSPAVWIAALGQQASHSSPTGWARNLLAAGGIEAVEALADADADAASHSVECLDSPIAAAAAFAASGLEGAVITGSDVSYRLRAAATASALRDSGAAFVSIVFEREPTPERCDELRAAGVSDIWHHRSDAVAALKRVHSALGIT